MYHSESVCTPIEFDWEETQENQEKENEQEETVIMLNQLVDFPACYDLKTIEVQISRCENSTVNSWFARYCNEPDGSLDFSCAYNAIRYFLGKYFYCKMANEDAQIEACDSLESAFGISAAIFVNAINCQLYKTDITLTLYDNSKVNYEL